MGFFDPIDWNGDGKHDVFDEVYEFALFQEIMNEDSDSDDKSDGEYDYNKDT